MLKEGKPTKQVDTLSAIADCLMEEEGIEALFSDKWVLVNGAGFVVAYAISKMVVNGEEANIPIKYAYLVYLLPKAGHIAVARRLYWQNTTLFELADPDCWQKIRNHILASHD